ncbi:protein commissureless 1 [Scaptodrosophila lebanonensis]|uniref:Protein commissureless 1 n=1 Tax=Drosophila lebanonensis TaxID=7225 RepID=A0A6J2T9Y3_DROLE|nr:protein commissureless 1 [Scaptodrosophila lebanonensis]
MSPILLTTTTQAATATVTEDYAAMETTTLASSTSELYADYIAAPASSMSPAAIAEHMQQNQITFEIPTAHDLRHIDALHSFNALLQRIGNAVAYDTSSSLSSAGGHVPWSHDSTITTEQLSKSVVLDLADLREHNASSSDSSSGSSWEQIFGDADMHAIINYLWIGVVTSLVVLSLIFIVFSCYFYRKFRTWKKCNKDIRAQIHGSDSSYSSHLVSCDRSLLQPTVAGASAGAGGGAGGLGNEAAFYQIESPPCYTIATGLPSYDEALHHQPRHFAYGMKFMYPSLAAVHHHHHHACSAVAASQAAISNWEKDELQRQNKLQKCKLSTTATEMVTEAGPETETGGKRPAPAAICINMPTDDVEQQLNGGSSSSSSSSSSNNNVVGTTTTATSSRSPMQSLLPAAAADDDCASLVVVVAA